MHNAPPPGMANMYSDLSGKRKALCIGINYTGTSSALSGCHNDAKYVASFPPSLLRLPVLTKFAT
jgi:hypothetical protein